MKFFQRITVVTIFLIVTIFLSLPSLSQDPRIEDAKRAILNLEFSDADMLLSELPGQNLPSVIETVALGDFVKEMINQTSDGLVAFINKSDNLLRRLESLKSDHPDVSIVKAEIYLYRSVLLGQSSEYQRSAKDVYRAWRSFKSVEDEIESRWRDKYLGSFGLLFDQVPDNYQKYLSFLGMEVKGANGIERLKRYYRSARTGSAEQISSALILLGAAKENLSDKTELIGVIGMIPQNLMQNRLVAYVVSLCYLKAGQNNMAVKILDDFAEAPEPKQFPYWYYQKGRMLLYRNDQASITNLLTFINLQPGRNLAASAMQKAGWFYLLRKNIVEFKDLQRRIISRDDYPHDQDRQARREAIVGGIPDSSLILLRLMWDGGYYSDCIRKGGELISSARYTAKNLAEIHYRLGRCYMALNLPEQALISFQKVIEQQEHIREYWLPNSALQMGIIYQKLGNLDAAKNALKRCLEMNQYGYQDGIRREAEKILREIK